MGHLVATPVLQLRRNPHHPQPPPLVGHQTSRRSRLEIRITMETTIANAVEAPAALRFNHAKVGMLAFLLSEVAFFSTLITTYIVFLQQTKDSTPSPAVVFHLPMVLVGTACLLSSSITIHFAEAAMR